MDLNPLICPQCGGEIHDYTAGQAMATCGYCGTQFYIPTVVSTPPPVAPPAPTFYGAGSTSLDVMGRTFGLAIGVVVVIIVVGLAFIGSKKTSTSSGYSPFASRTASPTPSPTPDPALLRFGGPGNGDGNFDDPTSLALDRNGQIYVSDSSMRVQEFDPTGKYLRTLKIPSTAAYYERAQQIGKILVGGDGKLYVGVGGVIQVYGPVATKAER
ncbi:MAG: hypothetical protein JO053_05895, partial [Acidobacteria bacterium]|nr:hypothetical protein [Acidobacteriota bacterium]